MSSDEPLIRVDSIWRYYGAVCAVRDVSFEVRRGEVLGFLGPNGAGKTTTMQIITGVLAASAGQVVIGGDDILGAARRARSRIGYLPEQPPLYPDLSVDEYLCYAGRLRGLRGKALKEAVNRARQRCGLETSGRRLIRNLSKGYQQRVGIAQAILHSPSVVILDEPTVGLDPNQIREIRALIRELGNDHSVILSTHILPEVQAICDRVLIIHNGELVLDRRLAELSADSAAGSLQVGLRYPPEPCELENLAGVRRVRPLDGHRFHIEYQPDSGLPEQLAVFAATQHWGLYELIPERDSLENVFIRLTGGDAPAAPAAA